MITQQRIATLLGIREDEVPKIMIVIGTSIFIGMGIFFYYTGGNAIFLAEYQEDALPYVYIINAVLVIGAGAAYSSISNVIPLTTRVYGSSTILASGTFLIWLSYFATRSPVLAFIMLVWYRILFVFGMIDGWELMGAAFNVHQAKRLFALSQLGVMIGMIMAAFVGAGLAPVIGATNLLLLSAVVLFIYLATQLRYVPRLGPFNTEQLSGDTEEKASIGAMLSNRYIVLLFGLKVCLVISLTLVEYLFSQQAVANFPTEESLASFFGMMFGVAMIINIFLVGLVSGRFISRYGMNVALLTTPLMLFVMGAAAGVVGLGFGTEVTGFFITACSLMFIMWTMPYVVAAPAQNILLQPLPTRLRTAARVAIEGGLGSGALIFAGLLILLFSQMGDDIPLVVVGLLLVVVLIWLGLATVTFRQYAGRLMEAVRLRFLQGMDMNIATRDDLLRGLSSSYADDIHASLALLGQSDVAALAPFYPELLQHPDPQVQRDVLRRVAVYPQPTLAGRLREMAMQPDLHDTVRADAVRAWVATEPDPALARLVPMLAQVGEPVADSILIAMAHRQPYQAQALEAIQAMPPRRAAAILGEFPPALADAPLNTLLSHADRNVIRRAILSVSAHHPTALDKCLSNYLTDDRYIAAVIASLKPDGEILLPHLEKMLLSPYESHKTGAVRLLGAIGGAAARQLLATQLQKTDQWELRHHLIRALNQTGYTTEDHDPILRLIDDYLGQLREIISYQATAAKSDWELLSRALDYEFERGRADLLMLHAFIYAREAVLGILHRLQRGVQDQGENLEALELLMPRDRARKLLPLIEPLSSAERAEVLDTPPAPPVTQIIEQDERGWAGIWTRACAVRTAALFSHDTIQPGVRSRSALLQKVLDEHSGTAYRPTWQFKISEFTEEDDEDPTMLSTLEKFAILRQLELFEQVPDPVLGELALILKEQSFAAGETLLRKGEMGDTLYIVAEGDLIVHASEDVRDELVRLDRGSVVGEFAVLDAEPRSAFVTTANAGTLLVLEQSMLYELMSIYPEIAQGIMKALVHKLRLYV